MNVPLLLDILTSSFWLLLADNSLTIYVSPSGLPLGIETIPEATNLK